MGVIKGKMCITRPRGVSVVLVYACIHSVIGRHRSMRCRGFISSAAADRAVDYSGAKQSTFSGTAARDGPGYEYSSWPGMK